MVPSVSHYTVVLFTRGDELEEPIEEYLASAPASLNALIDRCGGRYHVFNNKAPSDVQQVHELKNGCVVRIENCTVMELPWFIVHNVCLFKTVVVLVLCD